MANQIIVLLLLSLAIFIPICQLSGNSDSNDSEISSKEYMSESSDNSIEEDYDNPETSPSHSNEDEGIIRSGRINCQEALPRLFPTEDWARFGKDDLERLNRYLNSIGQEELDAIRELYHVPIFQPLFTDFFASFRNPKRASIPQSSEEYLNDFPHVIFRRLRGVENILIRARMVVFAIAIREHHFSGFVKLIKASQRKLKSLPEYNFVRAAEYIYQELLKSNTSRTLLLLKRGISNHHWVQSKQTSNSHDFGSEIDDLEMFGSTLSLETQVEAWYEEHKYSLVKHDWQVDVNKQVLKPFSDSQLYEFYSFLEIPWFGKFLNLFYSIVGTSLGNLYGLKPQEILDIFMWQLTGFVERGQKVKLPLHYRNFLLALTINSTTFKIFLSKTPENFVYSYQTLFLSSNYIFEIWNALPTECYDFRVELCLRSGFYCNPFRWNINNLDNLPEWLNKYGVDKDNLEILLKNDNRDLYTFLINQPLVASLAVTRETIQDALIGAPKVPISNALKYLAIQYIKLHRRSQTEWSYIWEKYSEAGALIEGLLKGKAFCNDPLKVERLFLNKICSAWNQLFEQRGLK